MLLECIKSWTPDKQIVVMKGDTVSIYDEEILVYKNEPQKFFDIIIESSHFNEGHELRISASELVTYFEYLKS